MGGDGGWSGREWEVLDVPFANAGTSSIPPTPKRTRNRVPSSASLSTLTEVAEVLTQLSSKYWKNSPRQRHEGEGGGGGKMEGRVGTSLSR